MDSSSKVQTLNLKTSILEVGAVSPQITSLNSKAGLTSFHTAKTSSFLINLLKKPNPLGISAFFSQFISMQRAVLLHAGEWLIRLCRFSFGRVGSERLGLLKL